MTKNKSTLTLRYPYFQAIYFQFTMTFSQVDWCLCVFQNLEPAFYTVYCSIEIVMGGFRAAKALALSLGFYNN